MRVVGKLATVKPDVFIFPDIDFCLFLAQKIPSNEVYELDNAQQQSLPSQHETVKSADTSGRGNANQQCLFIVSQSLSCRACDSPSEQHDSLPYSNESAYTRHSAALPHL